MKTLCLAVAAACLSTAPAADAAPPAPSDLQAPRMGTWGVDLSGRDLSVSPGQSFFAYANGTSVAKMEIPPDRSFWGAGFALDELSRERMRAVVERAAAKASATGPEAQIKALYASFMDEARVEALGDAPLQADLARVRAAKDHRDIARLTGETLRGFGRGFFSPEVYDDAKDPQQYTLYLYQSGLTLPDRDYYLQSRFEPQRRAFESYVAAMLRLGGWADPETNAKAILALETEIAKASWPAADRRDDDKTYNPHAASELETFAPGFDWRAYLEGAGLGAASRLVVAEETALPKIAAIHGGADVGVLKAWLAFTVIDQAAPYLPRAFSTAAFEFHGRTLGGVQAERPRWKRGVGLVDKQLGHALGKLYVEAYFPPESKGSAHAIVADVRAAMDARIRKLDWMGPDTKARALEKLSKLRVQIGYPDRWRDYSALQLAADDLYGNVRRAAAFNWDDRAARLNRPVDPNDWLMTPATVNAYYSPIKNEMVFPAAILQPPYFDPKADGAVNYGALGALAGHELTHGFDDQGRKLDGDGRLSEWWTKADEDQFVARAERLAQQYSDVEVVPGATVNGRLVLGEGIADLGGVLLALDAYHLSLKGRPAPVIDGLTGDQRVFLAGAQLWRVKYRDAYLRRMLVSDPHAPGPARIDVTLRNVHAFYDAFGVKPGDPMYLPPEKRARIW